MSQHAAIVVRNSPRPDLLVFEVRDKIREEDISWMSTLVEEGFETYGAIDLLLIMTNFEGAELGALTDEEAVRTMTRSVTHVRRYGVVGAPAWARAMITVFNVVSPVDAKTFDRAEEERAWDWINRPPSLG